MNLLVDMGNSRVKWAVGSKAGDWSEQGEFATADLTEVLDANWGGLRALQKVVVSNVAGSAQGRQLCDWFKDRWGMEPYILVAQREALGLRNTYRYPQDLGSDRWAAMLGAHAMTQGAFCVIDCGTAVTVDGVAADGEFIGGVIMPGLAMARAALQQGTAGVHGHAVEAENTGCRDTASGVSAGTRYGLAGAIDRVLDEHQSRLGETANYLTGGGGADIAPLLQHDYRLVPDLVLRGLARLAGNLA